MKGNSFISQAIRATRFGLLWEVHSKYWLKKIQVSSILKGLMSPRFLGRRSTTKRIEAIMQGWCLKRHKLYSFRLANTSTSSPKLSFPQVKRKLNFWSGLFLILDNCRGSWLMTLKYILSKNKSKKATQFQKSTNKETIYTSSTVALLKFFTRLKRWVICF